MKLEAKELRIGNWCYDNLACKDMQIVPTDLTAILQGSTIRDPIPLTEEWLEKFGFKNKDMADLGTWVGKPLSSDISLSFDKSIWIGEHDTGCIYVHQLQNLYFALTGEELKEKHERPTLEPKYIMP